MDEQAPQAPAPAQQPDESQRLAQHLKARVHALRHPPEGEQPPAAADAATLGHPQVAAFVEGTGADVLARFVGLIRSHPDGAPVVPAAPDPNPPAAEAQAPAQG